MSRIKTSLAVLLVLSGCVGAPAPEPTQPTPSPTPAPIPAPPPVAAPAGDWQDWPLTPGDWAYRRDDRGSLALYGRTGAPADFLIRCDSGAKRIYLSRAGTVGAGGAQMTVRTSAQTSMHPVRNTGGQPPYVALELAPRDPVLDRIAFSRGRFVVHVAGTAALVIPSWPEFTRVVEDCRG